MTSEWLEMKHIAKSQPEQCVSLETLRYNLRTQNHNHTLEVT